MNKILNFVGYNKSLELKNKILYIVYAFGLTFALMFLFFYVTYVKSVNVIILTLACILIFIIGISLLKYGKYKYSKITFILGFLLQETFAVFLWFPKESGIYFFYFIIPPLTFYLFDFEKKIDRLLVLTLNILATVLILGSVTHPDSETVIALDQSVILTFKISSVICTCLSIALVFYFFAKRLAQVHRELNVLAHTDSLTKISNRRVLFQSGNELLNISKKYERTFMLMLFDIDNFKNINDSYGHPVGDQILKQLTKLVNSSTRKYDIFARFGGEEFAIIVKDVDKKDVSNIGENLRKSVENNSFYITEDLSLNITISIGVIHFSNNYENFNHMLTEVDKALYEAKETGKNKVVLY